MTFSHHKIMALALVASFFGYQNITPMSPESKNDTLANPLDAATIEKTLENNPQLMSQLAQFMINFTQKLKMQPQKVATVGGKPRPINRAQLSAQQRTALPPRQREILGVREIHNYSPQQIAALTPADIANFTGHEIKALNPGQLAHFTRDQVAALRRDQIREFSQTQMEYLRSKLTAEQLAALE